MSIDPISFARRKWLKAMVLMTFIGVVVAGMILIGLYQAFGSKEKYGVIALVVLGYFSYMAIESFVGYIDKKLGPVIEENLSDSRRARKGCVGEDTVYGWLTEALDLGQCAILRNVIFPGVRGDADMVVIGPKGVVVVEVKNYSNPTRFERRAYYYFFKRMSAVLSWYKDPRHQLEDTKNALSRFLANNGLASVSVHGVLAFVSQVSYSQDAGVFVARDKDGIKRYFEDLPENISCTREVCERIKKILEEA